MGEKCNPFVQMIKTNVLIFSLIAGSLWCKGQSSSSRILYVLPDSVEIAANGYIQRLVAPSVTKQFYCLLSSGGNDTCTITITPYEERARTIITKWLSHSNRSVMINKTEYPLLTDLDFRFGLPPDENNIGQMGKRDGYISKVHAIPHAFYSIVFRAGNGKVVRIEQR
jgi:hypothetical protein